MSIELAENKTPLRTDSPPVIVVESPEIKQAKREVRVQKVLRVWLAQQQFYKGKRIVGIPPDRIDKYVDAISKSKYPYLCAAMFKVESRFNPRAISKKGAMGSAQIMPFHVKELKKADIITHKDDLFKIQKSVHAFDYLITKKLHSKKGNGNIKKAICLYSGNTPGYFKKISAELKTIHSVINEGVADG